MGRIKTITRRSFLVGSAAIAGGVAFGTYAVKRPHDNPLLNGLADGDATFNPWVKIDAQKVTLIVPHLDMGQGAASMQASLIAEELDLEFGQFEIDFGMPNAAYYNTAFGDEIPPFRNTNKSFQAETMRSLMGGVIKLLGAQGTGGSSSVPDSFDKLRHAGACARETLKLAAAEKTGIAVAQLKTENGAVILPDGTSIPYTDLASIAADIDPVEDAVLRDPSTWRLIGKPMQRLDIVAKSTGTLSYGIDMAMEGMVHATVKVNPRQGGIMNSYNADTALAMAGVQSVVPVTNGVAVIASNTWYAIQAANAIEFDWGPAPYPAEQADHWAEVAASFVPERLNKVWRADGDVDTALAAGDVVRAEYKTPYVAHQPLEPIGGLCLVTDERVDVWVGHQMPREAQNKVAAITGHDTSNVYLHNQYVGGSFGHRLEFENINLVAEIANQMRGTPVKLTFSREEDFAHDYPRQIAMARGQGTVKDGHVESFDLSIASVSAGASQSKRMGQSIPGPDSQIPAGAWDQPYGLENYRVTAYRVPELAPTSSWRSVGASSGGFFADCFMDELIHAAGADPIAERILMCDSDVARKVLEKAAEISNWGSDLGPNRGRGVAFVESFGVPVAEVVEVTNTPKGIKIDKVYIVADSGQIIDPINFENMLQGGVVWGLGHAMNSEITYSDGMAEQTNYHAAEGMRMYQCPEIIAVGLENAPKVRGIGEPPVPPAGAALANAIFNATGQRIREMPLWNHIDFV